VKAEAVNVCAMGMHKRADFPPNSGTHNNIKTMIQIDTHPITIKGPSGRLYQMHQPLGGDHQASHWKEGRFYEARPEDVLMWAYQNQHYFKRVVDVGASLGNHSVFFGGELGSEVFAIEPYTHDICEMNLKTNGIKATLSKFVIGHPGRYAVVPAPKGNVGMTSFRPAEKDEWSKASRSLAFLCRDFEPTAIKVDAEGANVFAGSWEWIASIKPLLIIEETDTDHLKNINCILEPTHKRMEHVFNSTPTHIYIPCSE